MTALAHLPRKLADRPDIRALSLRVYPCNDGYRVPGREDIYTVAVASAKPYLRCCCTASRYGRTCAHVIAVERYIAQQEGEIIMPTDSLDGALPRSERTTEYKKTDVDLPSGEHKGYFVGLGDPVEETFPDPCKICKGSRVVRGDGCRTCKGTGVDSRVRVPIRYQMGPDLFIEEWVTYILSKPGTTAKGQPKSASALYNRLRRLSGLTEPAEIAAWFKALPRPIKLPVRIMVIGAQDGTRNIVAECNPIVKEARPAPSYDNASARFGDDDV